MKRFFLLFFCASLFSQSKPVAITINSLKIVNGENERNYILTYTISNLSDKTINFILNPNAVIPIGSGSLNPSVYYKLYENESSLDVSGVFNTNASPRRFKDQKEMQKYSDSISDIYKNKSEEKMQKESQETTKSYFQNLRPKEEKQYQAVLSWDKKRYFRNDEIEYYINETAKHFFELHINLMQDELLTNFTAAEKEELLKGKNMVKGWFTSEKVEIDFTE